MFKFSSSVNCARPGLKNHAASFYPQRWIPNTADLTNLQLRFQVTELDNNVVSLPDTARTLNNTKLDLDKEEE